MSNTVWTSDRLIYRHVEARDEPFLAEMSDDAESFTQAAPFLPRPMGEVWAKGSREWIEKCFLGAIICLPAAPATAEVEGSTNGKSGSQTAEGDKEKDTPPRPTPVGYVVLMVDDPRFLHHRNAELGITMHRKYQGKGYGTEAIEWALRWGFRFAGLNRISIGAFEYNARAIELYKRIGFVPEGIKREHLWFDGQFWDVHELGMLEREWREQALKKGTIKPIVPRK